MEQENKKSELRKISNQKYYNKKKQDNQEIKSDPIINKIECTTKEEIKIEPNNDSSDWSDWWWETGKGSLSMLMQTLIQTITTIAVPAMLMWMMPRQQMIQNTITPSTSTSAPQSRQQQQRTDQQQTVSSWSQLM